MKIAILGANGGVGRQCVELALQQGHDVTAILRTPSKLRITHPNLHIIQGDINEIATISWRLQQADAIISAVGTSGGLFGDKPTDLYSKAAESILRTLQTPAETRVFFISASAIEISPVNPPIVRFFARYVIQKLLKHSYHDLKKMEMIIKNSGANWTIVRPPQLTDGKHTGIYRHMTNAYLPNCTKISRTDLADFMLNNIGNPSFTQAVVEVAY